LSPLIPKPSTARGTLVELVVIVALAIGLALLIQAFLVKPYQIPSPSMEPTLDVGQRVLVDRVSYRFSDPDIGDIVVFHPPQGGGFGVRAAMRCPAAAQRGLSAAGRRGGRHELHQANRRRARGSVEHQGRPSGG